MKRPSAAAVFLLFVAVTMSAAETHRYVVATKQPFRQGHFIAALQSEGTDFTPRDVQPFEVINGFAADLTDDEVAALRKSRNVSYVEQTVEYKAMAVARNFDGQTIPYGIDHVHARDVWPAAKGAAINVAIIDTGIDYRHPELAAVYAGGHNFVANPQTEDALDDNGHGTHVAGTIAAADNAIGVVGVAPQVRIWALKVLNASGSGSSDKAVAAIDWVLAKRKAIGGNWVCNLSLGSTQGTVAARTAFENAAADGLIIVAASGNESAVGAPAPVGYPAAYKGVIAVGAVDEANTIADFSNQGPELSFTAPGVEVLSTVKLGLGFLTQVKTPATTLNAVPIASAKVGTVTGEFVSCGVGAPGDFPASVAGRIAVIQRGADITFADKAQRAKAAGAIGVAIYNDNSGRPVTGWTFDLDGTSTFEWPVAVGLSELDGRAVLEQAGKTITISNIADDYATFSGTSMATPHVAGVAALVWSVAPTATAAQVKAALEATAHDLGASGRDVLFGFGLVDAFGAAKQLNPAAFGSPATPASKVTTGRRILRRGP
ncbi:MAG TPA: S8 family serine peptidase [Thermoanaerobaculia bacterium]|nr:S8 family serine peptidase [Thermoanaerobaculia bacterium]